MNTLIKITGPSTKILEGHQMTFECFVDDLGEDYLNVWHLEDPLNGERIFCDGFTFEDESDHESKKVNRGGVTCPNCLDKLKAYKAVKL